MAGIAIDLPGADAVLDKLRNEMGSGLAPVAHQGLAAIGTQALFGVGSPSAEVRAARAAYHDVATVTVANLSAHLSNSEHLVSRLEQAIEGYRQADALSAGAVTPQDEPVEPDNDDPTISSGAFGSVMVSGYAVTFRPPALPEPRRYVTSYCLDWGAYDIPRDAAILQEEGDDGAYQQVMALRALSAGLGAHYNQILALRDELAMVWSPLESEAAMRYQELLDQHIAAVVLDQGASSTNANLFYGIVDALAHAKGKIDEYHSRWNQVTTDWTPEFWDNAAQELDGMARTKLIETDSTIRDWRSGVIVTDSAKTFGEASSPDGPTGPAGTTEGGGRAAVSPVPGMNPVTGPSLAGAPQPVAPSAGNPPSMLPIPPGNPLAPNGGAWMLPQPGIGPMGRLMPMPVPPMSSGPGGPTGPGGPGGSVGPRGPGGPGGVRPPMAGPAGLAGGPGSLGGAAGSHGAAGQAGIIGGGGGRDGGKAGTGKVAPGAGREKWQVRQGVQPVIDGSQPVAPVPDRFGGDAAEFDAWFARTATPWTA